MIARWLYCLVLYLVAPLIWLRLILRSHKQPAYKHHRSERWGFYSHTKPAAPLIWIHAVSVGETRATEPLIRALLAHYPRHAILLTGMTPTGREAGQSLFSREPALAARITQAYLPYDYPGAVRRFLRHFQPVCGLLMETEIWPNLLAACTQFPIPVALVNARLSQRSARGYQRFAALTGPAFRQLRLVAAQTRQDAERLAALGANPVQVCGNLKFDVTPDPEKIRLGQHWHASFGQRPVWLAASTREGEEADLLAQHRILLKTHPNALCLLVPRHPQRFTEVIALVQQAGLSVSRRSEALPNAETQVWLGDSMGEMAAYYAATDIAIIGGSWQPLGGQNLIEAAACACPTIVGPHTFNFAQATEDALAIGAARRLPDTTVIAPTLIDYWANPDQQTQMKAAAGQFTQQHQGTTQRIMACIIGIIPPLN